MASTARRNVPLNLRATEQQRQLIDRAAEVLGKSRSEFMLESAVRAAEDVMLDQTYFVLGDEAFDEFMSRLEQPPPPPEALRKLMRGELDWDGS